MAESFERGKLQTLELPVKGMDCADCTVHVQKALTELEGVQSAKVFLSSEKAVVSFDPAKVTPSTLRQSIEKAGYSVPKQPSSLETIELPVVGMDCADCTVHVQKAKKGLSWILFRSGLAIT